MPFGEALARRRCGLMLGTMPTPGQIVRRLLGPAFPPVGEAYRRIFVDMARVADWMASRLPENARVLDVGGGDGYAVQLLLNRRNDIAVTMTDVAANVGSFIRADCAHRVTLQPATDAATLSGPFDAITLADVVHHVPVAQREGFLAMLGELGTRCGARRIIVKDIRPQGLRAWLALVSDLYVTGDRTVVQLPEEAMVLPGWTCVETAMPDFPNYCLAFEPSHQRQ